MKKIVMLVIILICVFVGSINELKFPVQQETTTPIMPSETSVIETTATPVKETTSSTEPSETSVIETTTAPVEDEKFDVQSLGIEPYKGRNGEDVYEASTCFFDDNGLLCIGIKATYDADSDTCDIEKRYYLPNELSYRETETKIGIEALQVFEDRIVKETYVTKAYEPITYRTITGHVWTTAGEMVKTSDLLGEDYANKFVCTGPDNYIPVTEGEKIRLNFYFSWFPQVGGIIFLNEKNQLISASSFTKSTTLEDTIITVPKGAEKMHLSLFAIQPCRVERQVELIGADLESITNEEYIEQSIQVLQGITKVGVEEYSFDKAYITFVLDDCRSDMAQVVDVFQQYKVPLCIAAINENLPYAASNGVETMQDVCERVVANGGEILSHDAEVVTENVLTDYFELVEHFYEDKWLLEQKGFDVNGIILAGGNGQIVGHETTDIWARAFYQYSDLYGKIAYGEPYHHGRKWLGNCLDTYGQVIQDAINEKKWIVFYFHEFREVSNEKLQEILQYVTSLSKEDIEVVTYKELYDIMW